MERMVLKKAASAGFLGDQQDPLTGTPQKLRRKKARMEDGALETVRKLGGHASLIRTLTRLREDCGFFTQSNKTFFFSSVTLKASTINSHRARQQTGASPQGICLCSVNPESYSVGLGLVRSSTLHSKWGRPQEDQ